MAELKADPYRFRISIMEILGDVGDRSIAGVRYLVKLGFQGADDLCYCGFSKFEASKIRTDGTRVTDEAPDNFFNAFQYALYRREITAHKTIDGRLAIGIYPVDAIRGLGWHCLPCEPVNFRGDPENVFKVIVSVNPYKVNYPGIPHGGGVGLVLPVHRKDMLGFIESWLSELRIAPKTNQFRRQDHNGHLLRWMPKE